MSDWLQVAYAAVALEDWQSAAMYRRVLRSYRRMFNCGMLDGVRADVRSGRYRD